jgi:hypothetical protein
VWATAENAAIEQTFENAPPAPRDNRAASNRCIDHSGNDEKIEQPDRLRDQVASLQA